MAVRRPVECRRFRGRWHDSNRSAVLVATQNVGAGGLGFRYKLANKFGMDAGIDVAHSPGTNALYFVVGNAWFRP